MCSEVISISARATALAHAPGGRGRALISALGRLALIRRIGDGLANRLFGRILHAVARPGHIGAGIVTRATTP